jgi:hypothetical protein
MRRPMTDDEREQRRRQMQAAWADGKFAHRRKGMHPRHWTPEQDDVLSRLAGTRPISEIADALERRFYVRRTEPSVRIRAKRLGVSLWMGGYGMRDLERIFGFDHRVIVTHWIEPGHLAGRRWQARGPNPGWWFEASEVERFIRECGWLVDLQRMPRGHRLTRLVETVQRAEPWITGLDGIGRILGMAPVQVKKWMGRGLIPYRRRPVAGSGGLLCVRGRDIPMIRAAVTEARAKSRAANIARFTAWRRQADPARPEQRGESAG